MENLGFLEVGDEEDECFYEAKDIVGVSIDQDDERMFEVKWKGYDSSYIRSVHAIPTTNPSHIIDKENTFEPERNLNCPELLQAFLENA